MEIASLNSKGAEKVGDYADWKQTERILATEGGKSVMNEVKSRFFGREIVDVRLSNEITRIGVTLAFASGDSAEVRLPELSLDTLISAQCMGFT